jgi:hypothetical protein
LPIGAAGDAQQLAALEQLGGRVAPGVGTDLGADLVGAGDAGHHVGEHRILGPFRALDEEREVHPLLGGEDAEADPAIGGRLDRGHVLARRQREDLREMSPDAARVGQRRQDGLELREIDPRAATVPTGRPQRGRDAERRVGSREPLDDLTPRSQRRQPGAAARGRGAAPGLECEVVRRPGGPVARRPEAREREPARLRADPRKGLLAEPTGLEPTDRTAVEDHVAIAVEREQRRATRPALEVEDERALARSQVAEEQPVAVGIEGGFAEPPPPQRIALRRLDRDDVRPRVGEQLRRITPGDAAGQVEHANAGEGALFLHLHRGVPRRVERPAD